MPILQNAKHEKFAQELAKCNSQDAAYAAAGYRPNASHASRLARNGKVKARVSELVSAGAEKAGVDIERVVAELAKIGFANIQDFCGVTSDGDPFIDLSAVTRDQAAAVQQIVVEDFKDGRGEDARDVRKITFKLYDKRAALVDLGRHLGLFNDGKNGGRGGGDGNAQLVPTVNLNAARRNAG